MSTSDQDLQAVLARGYQHGFVTDIESDTLPPGLDEDVIRHISRIKKEPQFMLDWRLQALARAQGRSAAPLPRQGHGSLGGAFI